MKRIPKLQSMGVRSSKPPFRTQHTASRAKTTAKTHAFLRDGKRKNGAAAATTASWNQAIQNFLFTGASFD